MAGGCGGQEKREIPGTRVRSRGPSVVGVLTGLVLLVVGAWAIGLPIYEAAGAYMTQRRADHVARLPVIVSAAQVDEARDGGEVLIEGRISSSNTFTELRTWKRQDNQYVVYDGKFAAYWRRHVRPAEDGVTYGSHVTRSVPSGLRVQLAPGAEVTIENADFKTGWEHGYVASVYGRDLPPLVDLVNGFEIGQQVTVQGRVHRRGGRRTIDAEYLSDTTAADYLRSLNQMASEAHVEARGLSGVLWALAVVVGAPSLIGGIFLLRRSWKNRRVRQHVG